MTSIGDLLCRTEYLLETYEKYDTPLLSLRGSLKDIGVFDDGVRSIEREIRDLTKQAEEIAELRNRATVAARNAEIRRAKNALLHTRIPELQRRIRKGKNVTQSVVIDRQHTLQGLSDAIKAIADGIRTGPLRPSIGSAHRHGGAIHIAGPSSIRPDDYRHSSETRQFESDWDESKRRQDEALNRIERGVHVLGNLARDMNQEVILQEPVLNSMEHQIDRVKTDIKTRNQQMNAVLKKMGKTPTICFDLTLIVILLALVAYIYTLVT